MIIFASFGGLLVGLGGYLFRPVRDAEDILPDHQVAAGGSEEEEAVSQEQVGDAGA